jgi:hypothetical protein
MKISSMVGIGAAMAMCLAVGTAQAGPSPVGKTGAKVAKKQVRKTLHQPKVAQNTRAGVEVSPIRVAPVKMVNGKPVVGQWQPYLGVGNDANWVKAFDCYESDDTGLPIGGTDCGVPTEDSRWWFGAAYYNPFKTEDMTPDAAFQGAFSERMDVAWAWQPPVATSCLILVFTFDAFGECTLPDADQPLDGGNGVILDFGVLDPGTGYYYTDADLQPNALGWTLPTGQGAYYLQFGNDVGGEIFLAADPCQMMLWGTPDARGDGAGGGTQMDLAWDDDVTPDGVHTEDECYTYGGVVACPDPLGGMIQFWVDDNGGNECYADCDGDTTLSFYDFLCFTNAFNSNDMYADCDGDTVLSFFDFLCFTNEFNAGCP